jgi:hypothetical protein
MEIHVRGYSKHVGGGRYIAVSLRPYLVVQAHSHGEARHRLGQLIDAYLDDAYKDGRLGDALARRAPVNYRLAYAKAWLTHHLTSSIKPIDQTCCISQHA